MGGRSYFWGLYLIPAVLLGLAFANLLADPVVEHAAIPAFSQPAPIVEPQEPALVTLADQTFYALRDAPAHMQVQTRLKKGGTLAVVLDEAGVSRVEAAYAIEALSTVFQPRNLRAGQGLNLSLMQADTAEKNRDAMHLSGLVIRVGVDRTVMVSRQSDGHFVARELIRETRRQLVRAKGNIKNSLYVSALDAGASDAVIIEFSRLYAYSVDFQRGIRSGDAFDMVFERFVDERGNVVKTGNLLYARLSPRNRDLQLYRYQTPDGETGFYNEKGESARRFLMKTPIDGARISSGFGQRKHPVLGYTRAHKGTDFAAGKGTPILAAGNGIVERASRFGSYGNYVRIRHSNGFKTAYAHMSKYGRGVKKGRRVSQGQIIGYVGATGRVTGAHLHYEVLKNGTQVNPMTVKLPSGRKLKKSELAAFEQQRLATEKLMTNALPALAATKKVATTTES